MKDVSITRALKCVTVTAIAWSANCAQMEYADLDVALIVTAPQDKYASTTNAGTFLKIIDLFTARCMQNFPIIF